MLGKNVEQQEPLVKEYTGKTIFKHWQNPKILKIHLLSDQQSHHQVTSYKNTTSCGLKVTCTRTFIAAFFMIVPSTVECKNIVWYNHTTKYHVAVKMNELQSHERIQMNLIYKKTPDTTEIIVYVFIYVKLEIEQNSSRILFTNA